MSAVSEAMNQMMGSTSTSLSEMFHKKVDISPPKSMEVTFEEGCEILEVLKSKEPIICISFRMVVEDLIDSNFVQLIPISFGKEMVSYLMGSAAEEEKSINNPVKSETEDVPPPHSTPPIPPTPSYSERKEEVPHSPSQQIPPQSRPQQQEPVVVRQSHFSSFDATAQNQRVETIDLVGDTH